ncbi:hypothetical protein BJY01DRAFT_241881 [Aspergillus pseudoustus]|uniref:PHD-type domain-containing protein n=1 Tax=Aspergillus pseudoustus TaxID=1810923 RepID=A0ABR4L4X8_9EURO
MLRGSSDSPVSADAFRQEERLKHARNDNGSRSLSATEQTQIYKRWVASGKPHNIICSTCQKPDNLLHCGTCSRSYHALCLSRSDLSTEASQFSCPPCKSSFTNNSATSSNPSHASTPTANHPFRITSPSNVLQSPAQRSLQSSRVVTPAAGDAALFSAPDALDPGMLPRAREFLQAYGGFPEHQEFSLELLLKLGSMMTELDFHRQQVQELASENSHLRQDNANIRAYLDSDLATGRPAGTPVADLSTISRPSADTAGKSWDRIVMDLI